MPSKTLTTPAIDLHARLQDLYVERALAQLEGLAENRPFMADLDAEITAVRDAYVGAAVTEIATFRADLSGRLYG